MTVPTTTAVDRAALQDKAFAVARTVTDPEMPMLTPIWVGWLSTT